MSRLDECTLTKLKRMEGPNGSLSPLYSGVDIPFTIKRAYYLYDIPGGAERGGHAHRRLQQFVVAASGSFAITLDDGVGRRKISLDRSYYGLYLPSMIWREITDFCSGAICLVFASSPYDEADYIRDYQEFLDAVRGSADECDDA